MYRVLVQRASKREAPSTKKLREWAKAAFANNIESAEMTIRIVDEDEIIALNSTYRKKTYATNVLSFPFEMTEEDGEMDVPLIGDIVICAGVVISEAHAQNKTAEEHWAHMVIHGILHLLGHDHEIDAMAEIMEAKEIQILEKLNFKNPYLSQGESHE